jgi:hypothetical protein
MGENLPEIQKPVYFLWNFGFYGFFYAALGGHYSFRKVKRKPMAKKSLVKAIEFKKSLKAPFTKKNKDIILLNDGFCRGYAKFEKN